MADKYYILLIALCCALIQSTLGGDEHDQKEEVQNKIKLGKVLAKDYDSRVGPGNTTLEIGLSFLCAQYDPKEKHLNTRVIERFSWTDWRLKWDPKDYGGLDTLKIPSDLVWLPDDVKVLNAFVEPEYSEDIRVFVHNDGHIFWVIPASYKTHCGHGDKVGDRKVKCHLSLGSWSYDSEDLPIKLSEKGVDTKYYLEDCPHSVSNVHTHIKTAKYECCPVPFEYLSIDFDVAEGKHDKHHGKHPRYDRHGKYRDSSSSSSDNDEHEEEDKHHTKETKGHHGRKCSGPIAERKLLYRCRC